MLSWLPFCTNTLLPVQKTEKYLVRVSPGDEYYSIYLVLLLKRQRRLETWGGLATVGFHSVQISKLELTSINNIDVNFLMFFVLIFFQSDNKNVI